ncbi:sensor histidine kinase [Rhodococcus sp. NPDC047139]|uniref:sensor histidine kinase n=1 Tax=Rhodococcus sp. NPDC047139 TaxID=3155141 RepID=UPI0033F5E1F7
MGSAHAQDRGTVAVVPSESPDRAERRARAIDVLLAAVVFVVLVGGIVANLGSDTTGPSPLAYVLAGFVAGAIVVRRTHPVAVLLFTASVLVAYYSLSLPPIGLAVPLAVALYSAAEQKHVRLAVGVAVASVVLSTSVRWTEGDDLAYVLGFEVGGQVGLMAAVIALGDSVRSRRALRAEMLRRERAAHFEREHEAARRVERERVEIARDLHDLLAHTVSIISLHAGVAAEAIEDDPPLARRSLAAVRTSCSRAVDELHATVEALRSTDDSGRAPTPSLAGLPHLVDTVSAAGIEVHLDPDHPIDDLPSVVAATAYRVVQEALSNVLRHADATTAVVRLLVRDGDLTVRVEDDGRGPGEDGSTGWGLAGMRERVGLLGGTIETGRSDSGGFLVTARIPTGGRS